MPHAKDSKRLQKLSAALSRMGAKKKKEMTIDPVHTANAVGLHYMSNTAPGIRRHGRGKNALYTNARGHRITDAATLRRIRALVIPPAWRDVWICADPLGHLQATGMDARGRTQYRYHALWRCARDMEKYHRLVQFAESLPRIRRRVERDLRRRGLVRGKVVAAVVRLLEESLIRIGNEEYAQENRSYGLTTLRGRQVEVTGRTVRFRFRGKSGKAHDITVRDEEVALLMRQERELPGDEVFQYVDARGRRHEVTSGEVNGYLRRVTGMSFTAKDFRTWAGTVCAALLLSVRPFSSSAEAKRNVALAITKVARILGNTPAVCRSSYVHPLVLESYLRRDLARRIAVPRGKRRDQTRGLHPGEAAVLAFLRGWLGAGA